MSIERNKDFEQLKDIAAMMAENPGIEFENGKYVYYGLDGRTAFAVVYISGAWAGWQAKAQAVPEGFDLWWEGNAIAMMCEEDEALKIWQAAKAKSVPEGFVLVPKEPTDKTIARMINTPIEVNLLCDHADIFLSEGEAYIAYQAMIEAQEPK